MADIAVFDVDGTLVDTAYQHAIAWYRSFRRHDLTFPVWRLHRLIGMGGDTLVPEIAGPEVEERLGDELRKGWTEEYEQLLPEVSLLTGARDLLEDVKGRGFRLVLASSGKANQVDHYLDLLDARSLAEAWTTSEDVERSKPEPDLIVAALDKIGGGSAVMIGDSVWDVEAAKKLDIPTLAVRTGGFSVEELKDAGAIDVFDSLVDFRARLDATPLAAPGR